MIFFATKVNLKTCIKRCIFSFMSEISEARMPKKAYMDVLAAVSDIKEKYSAISEISNQPIHQKSFTN